MVAHVQHGDSMLVWFIFIVAWKSIFIIVLQLVVYQCGYTTIKLGCLNIYFDIHLADWVSTSAWIIYYWIIIYDLLEDRPLH